MTIADREHSDTATAPSKLNSGESVGLAQGLPRQWFQSMRIDVDLSGTAFAPRGELKPVSVIADSSTGGLGEIVTTPVSPWISGGWGERTDDPLDWGQPQWPSVATQLASEQVARLRSIVSGSLSDADAAAVVQAAATVQRMLSNLRKVEGAGAALAMKTTFITRIGEGLQLEWQLGDRYMEVEVTTARRFGFLAESEDETEEDLIDSEADLARRFAEFWNRSGR